MCVRFWWQPSVLSAPNHGGSVWSMMETQSKPQLVGHHRLVLWVELSSDGVLSLSLISVLGQEGGGEGGLRTRSQFQSKALAIWPYFHQFMPACHDCAC